MRGRGLSPNRAADAILNLAPEVTPHLSGMESEVVAQQLAEVSGIPALTSEAFLAYLEEVLTAMRQKISESGLDDGVGTDRPSEGKRESNPGRDGEGDLSHEEREGRLQIIDPEGSDDPPDPASAAEPPSEG